MIETKWRILKWNGLAYVLDVEIPAPNKSFKEDIQSNTTITKLADGQLCLERPVTKTTPKAITWTWLYLDGTFKARLMNYSSQATRLKIECKNSNEAYDGDFLGLGHGVEGLFLEASSEWIIGKDGDTQLYEVTATFQPFGFA